MDFTTMSAEERAEAISKMDAAALTAALTSTREKAAALFALDAPTIAQVNEAETLVASIQAIEAEQTTREQAATEAAQRFAAARATFAGESTEGSEGDGDDEGDEAGAGEGSGPGGVETGPEGDEPAENVNADAVAEVTENAEGEGESGESGVTTASARAATTVKPGSVARKVGKQTKRPAAKQAQPVTITAAADVPGFATGSTLSGMEAVAKATLGRVKAFAPHNRRAAEAVRSTGTEESLSKFGVASFGLDFDASLVADGGPGKEYGAVKTALKDHNAALVASLDATVAGKDDTLTAAGWCAPSEVTYTWLADYVVDGLLTLPEVNAPRGGLLTTTGPALAERYTGTAADGTDLLDTFGFGGTEAQAEAGYVKTCETIECPEFEDHRLDFVGYCWKIPLLTQKAYPELVADALRLSSVLYAHKMNRRFIGDIVALSTSVTASGLGATFTDTLEALAIIAIKERRRWNLGENAVMEVKMPQFAKEVFRADVSRRMNAPVAAITDQQINAEFAARRLAPEYVSDWQEMTGADPRFPAAFDALIYPAGTFVKAVEDVINLSAVYDAASLSVNEYTGVFFEQGVMTFKAGYGSTRVTVPICTAGLVGAAILDCATGTATDPAPTV